MQTIVDAYGCHASKQSNSRDRELICPYPIVLTLFSMWISSTAYHSSAPMIGA